MCTILGYALICTGFICISLNVLGFVEISDSRNSDRIPEANLFEEYFAFFFPCWNFVFFFICSGSFNFDILSLGLSFTKGLKTQFVFYYLVFTVSLTITLIAMIIIDYSTKLDIIASDFVIYIISTVLLVCIWQMFGLKIILIKSLFNHQNNKSLANMEEEIVIKEKGRR